MRQRARAVLRCVLLACGASAGSIHELAADEFERPPISYSESTPDNPIERLQARLDDGVSRLSFDERTGYLPAVLDALKVSHSSQTLVFSKTSLQQQKITPRNPRALYFNDDVYVGYVRTGDVLELSVADPELGTVFYTLDQQESDRPQFIRQTSDCLICHGGSQTRSVPGHVVRSVYPDAGGQPIFSAGSHRVDHATPFEARWGGWYVTGSHGAATHLGNITYRQRPDGEFPEDTSGLNVQSVVHRFDPVGYLEPHSDLVALMVLAHQTHAHNVIVRAAFDVRTALYREKELNRELGEPANHRWPSTNTVLDASARSLVECFLFCDEPRLAAPIAGTSGFAREFSAAGPRDAEGRSLRDLDLEHRLFRYPCSFLIYSESFAALPGELRDRFWARLDAELSGEGGESERGRPDHDSHLTADERQAIRAILAATMSEAPASWRP